MEILIEGKADGAVRVYIGNLWHAPDASNVNMLNLSSGVTLVHHLLQECYLGRFFNINLREIRSDTAAPVDPERDHDGFIWIGVELTPLALYDLAKEAGPTP